MTADELRARLNADALAEIEKVGFSLDFVARNVASAAAPVSVSQIAMLWMGMPNKHDRKRTRRLFDLLTDAGVMILVDEPTETWRPV